MSQSGVTGCEGGDGRRWCWRVKKVPVTRGKLLFPKGHVDLDLCLEHWTTKGAELLQRPRQVRDAESSKRKKIHQSHFLCIYVNTLSKVACTSEMILHDVMWHVTAMWNDLTWFDPIRHVRPIDTRQMIYDRIRHELLQYAVLPKDVCVFTKNADVVRDTKYCIGHIRRR